MSDYLKAEDYKKPICPFCTDFYSNEESVKSINTPRIIEKLDEHLSHNDYDAAQRHLEYWLQEAREGRDSRGALAMQNELMGLFRKQGNADKAKEAANDALSLLVGLELEESVTGATTFLNVATVYKAFGDAAKALSFYEKARGIYEKHLSSDDTRFGGLYNNTALALSALKKYSEARECLKLAISVMHKNKGCEPEEAISYLNLADLTEAEKGAESGAEEISKCIEKAEALLNTPTLVRDGNYAFVCEKCAPTFDYYGYFLFADELKKRAREIYERT